MKKIIIFLFAIGILIVPFSCKKDVDKPDPEPEPRTYEVIVNPITKVMNTETRNAISSIDTSNFTFTFNGSTEILSGLKVGDILVDSISDKAEFGYLRKITAITASKGETIVETEQGKLSEAVPQGSIRFQSGPLEQSQLKTIELAKGVTLLPATRFKAFEFEFDKEMHDPDNPNAKINIEGLASFSFENILEFDWSFALDWDFVEVDLFKSAIHIEQFGSIDVQSQNGAVFKESISFAKMVFTPWTFAVGPVPVTISPQIELIIEASGIVKAELSCFASEEYAGEIGLEYTSENGWKGIGESDADLKFVPPALSAGCNFQTHVGPVTKLLFYGVAGPMLNISAFYELKADLLTATNYWNLEFNVGARSQAGINISILGFPLNYTKDLFEYKVNVFSLNNEPFDNSVNIINPVENHNYAVGKNIQIRTTTTGETPSEVQFYANDQLIGTDNEAPYEYNWNTSSYEMGSYTLKTKSVLSNEILESEVININLINATWEVIDMTGIGGQNDGSANKDIFFADANTAWIAGGASIGGYLLKTMDGGNSWENIAPEGFILPINQILYLNDDKQLLRMSEGSVFLSGVWNKEFGYLNYLGDWVATFDDEKIYNLAINADGMIQAIGKPLIYDENFYIYEVNSSTHEQTASTQIDYHDAYPKIHFYRNKGIVYNIKSNNNPLKQYYMITDNGGASWETKEINVSGITANDEIENAFFLDENKGWLVGNENYENAIVLITEDGGQSWEKVSIPEAYTFGSVQFFDQNEGYATVSSCSLLGEAGYKLYHTQDGGYTWEAVEDVYTDKGMNKVFFLGSEVGMVAGMGTNAYRYNVGK